jgi:predicted metalloprotease with PDZ domain
MDVKFHLLLRLTVILVMTQSLSVDTQSIPAGAQQSAEPIRYTVSFPEPQTHYMEVSAIVPTGGRATIEMMMAVWTPGSYLVREYSRHVEGVRASASAGRAASVEKTDKNRWRITTGGAPSITVSYRVYGREMSVRTNWVEAGFALVNGAPTFLTLADSTSRPHEVVLNPAAGWRRSFTGLPAMGGGEHRYRAPDFDTLVDSPILLGNPAVYEFTVDGKPHYVVNEGESGVFDGARAARDFEVIVREQRTFWGQLPYDKYVVLNLITEASGGLEHRNSTVLMTSRWATRTRRPYLSWLELASHELFHAWNVKRLRPVELGPFDYENENQTRSLWMAEGVTDYLGELLVHRADLSTRDEYLDSLSSKIEELQTTPGREVQSAELASFDAWIRYYRPDENSPNVSISYYTKGAVVAFLLDAKIRTATGGARSLDDVMRAAYPRYSGPRGFTPDEFRRVAEEVAGTSLRAFWAAAIEGTEELDYDEALQTFGLRFRANPGAAGKPWLGITTRNDAGRLLVSQVRRETPGMAAGLNVDDEILAIDDFRVRADQLPARLDQYRPGEKVTFLVARRDKLLRLDVTLGAEPPRAWRLEVDPAATDAQKARLGEWLGSGS